MGRKFRISSAEKEKEKIRNSILEVFRARLRSPGGGGAIVVGQNNTETDKQHTLHKATNEELGGDTSSSSMSDRDACPNFKYMYNQKKKRRRVKSKTKHTKKVKKEKADITRNLKMVNNIRTALNQGGSREDGMRKISVITHNRLTNKLGLFNPGRKSETISREISVSETVKHKAEEDLKTILSHDNNYGGEDENHPMDLHHNSPPPRQLNLTYAGGNTCTKKDIGYFSRGSSHSVVTPLPSQSVMTGSVSCVSVASIESDDGLHSLPKTPPYEETAAFLISALRPKQFFPERNLFQETIEELQTVMRKSTPLSATPTYCNFVKQRIASGSVKRSLLDRYPPSASTATSEDISMQVEERSTSKHKHNLKLSNPAKPSTLSKSDTENDRNKETIIEINDTEWSGHDVEHGTSKPESLNMNNKSKTHDTLNLKVETKCREKQIRHKYTDILYSDYRIETKSKETNPEKSYNTLSRTETNNDGRSLLKSNDGAAVDNGRSLLQCNDEAAMINMSVDTTVNFFGSVEEDHYNPASTDYQRHTDKLFESANKSCVNTLSHCIVPMDTHNHYHGIYVSSNHSSQSSGYQGSQSTNVLVFPGQRSSSSMNEGIKSNLAVITKFREHPEYMPTFHSGMYTSDRDIHTYGRLDTLTSAEIKSMDMLDLLDHDCIERLPERRTTVQRLKSTTPDSDGSPLWLPPDHLLQPPAKPSLENLSPPKKLYPRRLY